MDEQELEASLSTYKIQLSSVESALAAAGDNDDLLALKQDLQDLITMTEESLVSAKKQKLLAMLGETTEQPSTMDDEFAAFQAALSGDVTTPTQPSTSGDPDNDGAENSPPATGEDNEDIMIDPAELGLGDIEGTKCRVPYTPEWGHTTHHNALIFSVEPVRPDTEPKLRVLFCQPTQQALLTCPYFLSDRCKYSDDQCRFCHGYVVPVSKLEEFIEPDFSRLQLSSRCLAKYSDSLWYEGIVVEVTEQHFQVLFEEYEETITVGHEDVMHIVRDDESSSSSLSSSDEDSAVDQSEEEDELEVPVFLWRPQTSEALGEWEQHTKGIGSRLMQKMGYVVGEGLGIRGAGRAEPVPIQLLPQGKSLDKIMELKERAGDQDLYDVLKRQKHRHKHAARRAAKQYQKAKEKEAAPNVFDIINKKLGQHKKGDLNSLVKSRLKTSDAKNISMKELGQKSAKDINIQFFQTAEEISKVEKEVNRLKSRLKLNNNKDPGVTTSYNKKIQEMETYLNKLKHSQNSIQNHKQKKSDHKKMAIF